MSPYQELLEVLVVNNFCLLSEVLPPYVFHSTSIPVVAEWSEEIVFTQLSHSVTTQKMLLSSKDIIL